MAGAIGRSFSLLLFGMFLFGIGNASNLLSRSPRPTSARWRARPCDRADRRGATLGAILGPNLLALGRARGRGRRIALSGSAFLVGIVGFGVAAVLVDLLLRPDPLTVARELHAAQDQAVTPRLPSLAHGRGGRGDGVGL